MGVRSCACGCGDTLPQDAPPQKKYINEKHRNRQKQRNFQRRHRNNTKAIRNDRIEDGKVLAFKGKDESLDNRGSYRRGPKYEAFCETDYPEAILRSEMTNGQVADEYGVSHTDISRWMAAYLEDKQTGAALKDWTRDEAVDAALMSYQPFAEHFHPDALIPDFHL